MTEFVFETGNSGVFDERYRRLTETARDRTTSTVRPHVQERLIRCIWFDQEFDDLLRTEAGDKITVLSPGWWNLESGPDFKNASLKFSGGKVIKGDIELHLYASGWNEHGHQNDEAYDKVILHVAVWNDTGKETTHQHDREIPILTLDSHIANKLNELSNAINPEEYPHSGTAQAGRCQELLQRARLDPEWVALFFDHAGDERMLKKASRFANMPEFISPENVLYVSLMEAAGFKKNKKPMGRLARLVPFDLAMRLLSERGVASLQAVMLGMAGLIPPQLEILGAEPDAETSAYLWQLRNEWAKLSGQLDGSPLHSNAWTLAGVRPANYPQRRIAGISRLLSNAAEYGGLVASLERQLRHAPSVPSRRVAKSPAAKSIIELLSGVTDEYWSFHTTFGGRKLATPMKLIGTDRASVMFVDAVVPIMLAFARSRHDRDLENRLHRAYATFPPLESNNVLDFMALRIFGGIEPAKEMITSARRQQGLIQLFRDYCEANEDGCRQCAFAKALGG